MNITHYQNNTANRYEDFYQVVQQHRNRLYRFILKQVRNTEDAADLTQQTLVEGFRSLESFRGESELSTWLYSISLNLVRNYLMRLSHRVRFFDGEEILMEIPSLALDPDVQMGLKEIMTSLQAQLDELPDSMRSAFEMVMMDNMSYEEAAEQLNVPVGTIRSRIFRARALLKAGLETSGIEIDFKN